MLYTLIIWNILLVSCSFTGLWVLSCLKVKDLIAPAERLILSAWTGLALQCLGFLTLALFIPLNPVGPVLILASCLIPFGHWLWRYRQPRNRKPLRHQLQDFWSRLGLPLLLIEIIWAIFSARPVTWFDSGVYHLGAVHWLSHYGFVPGLALINNKLGFISSWFAFSAAITPGFLGDRIGAVSNTFLVILVVYTLLILFQQGQERSKPWPFPSMFLATYLIALTLAYIFSQVTGREILTSFAHDMPVNYMVGIVAWSVLTSSRLWNSSALEEKDARWRLFIIPLGLACIIVTIKMTGLFLIPIIFDLFLSKVPRGLNKLSHWLIGIGLVSLLLLPLGSAQVVTSGCLLYPSQSFCLPVPWTVSSEAISQEAEVITRGGLLLEGSTKTKVNENSHHPFDYQAFNKITKKIFSKELILGKRDEILSPLLLIFSFLFGSRRLLIKSQEKNFGENWILISGILGSCFIVGLNPQVSFRFGMGILLLLPAYYIATTLTKKNTRVTTVIRRSKAWLTPGLACLIMVFNLKLIHSYFLLPPPPSTQPDVAMATTNEISYYYLKGGDHYSCWYAPLPCSPGPLDKHIYFRDPSLGLRGGFVYRSNLADARS
ncbi:MAG: LIC_10190 family membrane protein [Nodosilinea sp.]